MEEPEYATKGDHGERYNAYFHKKEQQVGNIDVNAKEGYSSHHGSSKEGDNVHWYTCC